MSHLDDLTFEQAYEELTAIIEQMESGTLPLDESVKLYERGQNLSAYCERLLEDAELRINQLNEDGSISQI